MKKQIMAVIVGMSFLLGCGTQKIAEETRQAAETVRTEETEQLAEAEAMPEAYRKILNRTYEILCGESESVTYDYGSGETGIAEIMINGSPEIDIYHVGYELMDIDENGTEELIIADRGTYILAMYTLKENEAVLLAEGWSRNYFYLLDDRTIFNQGSCGASYSIFSTLQMAEDGFSLEVIDYYFTYEKNNNTTEVAWFYNTTGEWDREKSEMISEEEMNKIDEMEERYFARIRPLNLTYFSEFEPL